jgi:hypothetical protein
MIRILIFIFLLSFLSCSKFSSTKESYKAWFSDPSNGYIKSKNVGNTGFTVIYKPAELVALSEFEIEKSYTITERDSILSLYKNSYHFIMVINMSEEFFNKKVRTTSEYLEFFEKLSFRMAENVRLINGDTEIPVSLFHHERGYELGNGEVFIFTFPKMTSIADNLTFQYQDEYFNASILNFTFNISELKLPTLPIKVQ